ncbi:MAG: TM0106 family RecB-like putative nuclease [Candidatus Acidiferrales bacterium]
MITLSRTIRLSATDASNHLACRHLTSLDLSVARGSRAAPKWRSPDLAVVQQLGARHEEAYLHSLLDQTLSFADLRELRDENASLLATDKFMRDGADVIAQGSMAIGRWFGRPDVLRKVSRPSRLGNWSYEVYDCKLTRETKAATILQLSLYSELLAETQGAAPEFMHVVLPGTTFVLQPYRVEEYSAYYRYVKARLESACDSEHREETYPEPCAHCDVCRWFRECDARRRGDDHLSLVAGITRLQRNELTSWKTDTMTKLASLPVPLAQKPTHGSREGLERVREQARVQVEGRTQGLSIHEPLPISDQMGFCNLPEPSTGDMFVDLEGDRYVGNSGHEYLFGFAWLNHCQQHPYERRWAFSATDEKRGFEWIVDEVMQRWKDHPAMHVYHFGAYEPTAFKRLMGTYATREDEIDRMLRAGLFVDLHSVLKQALRASVEEYSLKALEAFHKYERTIPLATSREAMRRIEHSLELGRQSELPENVLTALEGYNKDDCLSTASLRDWMEAERQKLLDQGVVISRPVLRDGAPSEAVDERQKKVEVLVAQLVSGISPDPLNRSEEEQARWILAQLLDWHRRENKATWWEGFRLAALDDQALMEERSAVAGLRFAKRLAIDGKIPTDRYTFDKQETEVRLDKDLYQRGEKFGSVIAIDVVNRTIDVKKTRKTAELHPTGLYMWDRPPSVLSHEGALLRIGEWVRDNGIDQAGNHRAARDLLLRKPPRLLRGETLMPRVGEETKRLASRVAGALDDSVYAIQGPPGAGKTYTGARMICKLVLQGKRVGITALSHNVIHLLLEEVIDAAQEEKIDGVRCMEKVNEVSDDDPAEGIIIVTNNEAPLGALRSGAANVVGGTSWLWTRPEYFDVLDALFIDEAGQMSLADVLAVSQAAKNLILIGDPQQLDRPLKGSHPDGAEKSALQHLLGQHKTIPSQVGLLLPETWRMHPNICGFTSQMFYEGRLGSREVLRNRVLDGHDSFSGAGLWFVPVAHEGNCNSSAEEVEVVARIVQSLLRPEVKWFYGIGNSRPLTLNDILIVAPYNAQVADLSARLPGARVGTVDKFQGQEAPVVVYSLTTSSPEEAPRGMEFLYSLNRLNVATSRAMSNVILVGSPRLFEPECRSPRQMQLANALCRYLELATAVDPATL